MFLLHSIYVRFQLAVSVLLYVSSKTAPPLAVWHTISYLIYYLLLPVVSGITKEHFPEVKNACDSKLLPTVCKVMIFSPLAS